MRTLYRASQFLLLPVPSSDNSDCIDTFRLHNTLLSEQYTHVIHTLIALIKRNRRRTDFFSFLHLFRPFLVLNAFLVSLLKILWRSVAWNEMLYYKL